MGIATLNPSYLPIQKLAKISPRSASTPIRPTSESRARIAARISSAAISVCAALLLTSTRAAYRHDHQLDMMNSLTATAEISRNLDGSSDWRLVISRNDVISPDEIAEVIEKSTAVALRKSSTPSN